MDIVIVGNARCYHTMDKYRLIKDAMAPRRTVFLTDLVDSESHEVLVTKEDDVEPLFNIDRLLFKTQSSLGDRWRNLVKTLAIPIQVARLRAYARRHPESFFHAITMYYLVLCWAAGIPFIGTPQGSEILQRPFRSRLYRAMAARALRTARHVIVDSKNMRNAALRFSGVEASVVKNGFDVAAAMERGAKTDSREGVVSIRGMHSLYRIREILESREASGSRQPLSFIYPFWDDSYKKQISGMLRDGDRDLGRLSRYDMYDLFRTAVLAISIPRSDSSPRSVYEAIFAGCCVAVAWNPWIEELPACMRDRLIVVDPEKRDWFGGALERAREVAKVPYRPSEEALAMCDQDRIIRQFCRRFYPVRGLADPASKCDEASEMRV